MESSANSVPQRPHGAEKGSLQTQSSMRNSSAPRIFCRAMESIWTIWTRTRLLRQPFTAPYAAVSEEYKQLEELLEGSDEESRQPGPGVIQKAYDKIFADGSGLLFGFGNNGDLKKLHPPAIEIFRLWQTYFTSVYPLTMVFHAPTVQQQILDASSDLDNISESMEALMFAIYYGAVIALTSKECETMFGQPQPAVVNKYLLAAQQALNAAKLLTSLNIMVLQALVIFLLAKLASRNSIDPRSLWVHCGTAVRLGQRIGLHCDGTALALPPFEVEIRRRLWWQIVILDIRLAELSGAGTSMLAVPFDTRLPLNVNDADLKPEMGQLPPEHTGTTDMTFCLARYEMQSFLKQSNNASFFFDGVWAKSNGTAASSAEKDTAIDELQSRMENKYLKHCTDPKIALHFLTKIFANIVICRMRLVAHHPRHRPDKGVSMSAEEKEYICRLSLELVENDNVAHSNKSADKFEWYMNMHFQFPALIYLLSELRHRTRGELAERGWMAMNEGFRTRVHFIAAKKELPMFKAVSVLALKAWQAREMDAAAHGEPLPGRPEYILIFRSIFGEPPSKDRKFSIGGSGYLQSPANSTTEGDVSERSGQVQVNAYKDLTSAPESSVDPGIKPTEWSPMDWSYWDELIQNWEPQLPGGSELFDFGHPLNFNGQ
ncbi:MAG: hypothetical protein Q9166_001939 [cf. Caloplaca sp. 2 TL-2023]